MPDSVTARRRQVLEEHQAYVAQDGPFQARLRLQQALWRESVGLEIGQQSGRPLGSRISVAAASAGANAVDPAATRGALARVSSTALVDRVRLADNLLSSQPLAFNLFASLAEDLDTASRVFGHLFPGEVRRVTDICFEHSPKRGDDTYLGNHSAFDVLVEYDNADLEQGFLGIEVKYSEDLHNPVPTERRPRYDEVAQRSGVFLDLDGLWRPPLWQLWLDHLLALSMLQAGTHERGAFVLLAPVGNGAARRAARWYAGHLLQGDTFRALTLEDVLATLLLHVEEPWVHALWDRYGDQARLIASGFPAMR